MVKITEKFLIAKSKNFRKWFRQNEKNIRKFILTGIPKMSEKDLVRIDNVRKWIKQDWKFQRRNEKKRENVREFVLIFFHLWKCSDIFVFHHFSGNFWTICLNFWSRSQFSDIEREINLIQITRILQKNSDIFTYNNISVPVCVRDQENGLNFYGDYAYPREKAGISKLKSLLLKGCF